MRAEIGHVRVMSRFVLVSVALSVASAQRGGRPAPAKSAEMCWEMKHGYNAVKGMLKAPRTERRPEVFYFGDSESMEGCRAACEQEDECAAFTWMGAGKGGGWLGGGNAKWSKQCYGRSSKAMTMVPDGERTSGVKMPCAQLEELERSFGTDPARLVRSKEASKADDQAGGVKQAGGGPRSFKLPGQGGGGGGGASDESTGGDPMEAMMGQKQPGGAPRSYKLPGQGGGAAEEAKGEAGEPQQPQDPMEAMMAALKKKRAAAAAEAAGAGAAKAEEAPQNPLEAMLAAQLRAAAAAAETEGGGGGGGAGRSSRRTVCAISRP